MFSNFAILDFGMPELLIILAILVLLFGGKKLPELSRGLGESVKNIREGFKEANGVQNDIKKQVNETKQTLLGTTPQPTNSEEKPVYPQS